MTTTVDGKMTFSLLLLEVTEILTVDLTSFCIFIFYLKNVSYILILESCLAFLLSLLFPSTVQFGLVCSAE